MTLADEQMELFALEIGAEILLVEPGQQEEIELQKLFDDSDDDGVSDGEDLVDDQDGPGSDLAEGPSPELKTLVRKHKRGTEGPLAPFHPAGQLHRFAVGHVPDEKTDLLAVLEDRRLQETSHRHT